MARPREFSVDDALEKAMHVFWAKGYEATSLRDLTRSMGLSKSSFYDTFGCKHDLFLAALDHYNETVVARRPAGVIANSKGPKAGIAAVFNYYIDNMLSGSEVRGCFTNNSAIEMAPHDADVAAKVQAGFGHLENIFFRAVVQGQKTGEIASEPDAKALACYLCMVLNGLIVVAKANPPRRMLEQAVSTALSALD